MMVSEVFVGSIVDFEEQRIWVILLVLLSMRAVTVWTRVFEPVGSVYRRSDEARFRQ